MLLHLGVLYILMIVTSAGEFQCNVCRCYYTEPTTFMDCSDLELDWLPVIDEMVAFTLTTVYLKNNNITILDTDILETWDVLNFLDISKNPLNCDELVKLPSDVEVVSDCIKTNESK